ncbi:hypothetical protein E3N88_30793 [Mikania micrantha]|uniref:DUF4283 domain-containing protein n=1 Tax=Mikania micrantha TaxID=192012 RepID=A0A5N6MNK5_9ASTR|nr:hypothetical protein E3N88_30793 [Mikania micrantha]
MVRLVHYIDVWEGRSGPFERIAWVRIFGVPPNLWDPFIMNQIGGKIGKVIHKSEASVSDCNLFLDCLAILVSRGDRIQEQVTLKWKGKRFICWVSEDLRPWVPDFVYLPESQNFSGELHHNDHLRQHREMEGCMGPQEHEKSHGDVCAWENGDNHLGSIKFSLGNHVSRKGRNGEQQTVVADSMGSMEAREEEIEEGQILDLQDDLALQEEIANTIRVAEVGGINLAGKYNEFDAVAVASNGRLGGLLSIWDPSIFQKQDLISNQNYLMVSGSNTGFTETFHVLNVYGPQDLNAKKLLWDELEALKLSHPGIWVMMGDFNEVRTPTDRLNWVFCHQGALMTSFLMLKLLEKWSDHCPIILITSEIDFGPIPFRFFSSWFKFTGLNEVVIGALESARTNGTPDKVLAHKLKVIKEALKRWVQEQRIINEGRLSKLWEKASKFESEAKKRDLMEY